MPVDADAHAGFVRDERHADQLFGQIAVNLADGDGFGLDEARPCVGNIADAHGLKDGDRHGFGGDRVNLLAPLLGRLLDTVEVRGRPSVFKHP